MLAMPLELPIMPITSLQSVNMAAKLYKSKVWLTKRYLVDKKTVEEIAKECDTSHQTIYRHLVEFGLVRDQRTWKKR